MHAGKDEHYVTKRERESGEGGGGGQIERRGQRGRKKGRRINVTFCGRKLRSTNDQFTWRKDNS